MRHGWRFPHRGLKLAHLAIRSNPPGAAPGLTGGLIRSSLPRPRYSRKVRLTSRNPQPLVHGNQSPVLHPSTRLNLWLTLIKSGSAHSSLRRAQRLNKSRGLRRRCRRRQQQKFQLWKLQSYKGCGSFTPRDPLNPLIKASLFPGGKGKTKKRPMTLEELLHIEQHLLRNGKKSHWAKELHRRIHSWDWEHPRSWPSFRNKVAVGKPAAGLNPKHISEIYASTN